MTVSYHTAPQLRDCFRFRRSIALQAIKSYITVGDARFKVRSRITSIRRSRIVGASAGLPIESYVIQKYRAKQHGVQGTTVLVKASRCLECDLMDTRTLTRALARVTGLWRSAPLYLRYDSFL